MELKGGFDRLAEASRRRYNGGMRKRMGTFYAGCHVANLSDRDRMVEVPKLLVDSGSECTWIAASTLEGIGVAPEKKDMQFQPASGGTITRTVGFAIIRVGERFTVDEVVFAQKGDLQLLGARTLRGLNLMVDPARKRLIAAGPLLAAVCVGSLEPLPKLHKVGGRLGLEQRRAPGQRVLEGEAIGVEHQARGGGHAATVELGIAHHGMAEVGQVGTDLMGAAGQGLGLD